MIRTADVKLTRDQQTPPEGPRPYDLLRHFALAGANERASATDESQESFTNSTQIGAGCTTQELCLYRGNRTEILAVRLPVGTPPVGTLPVGTLPVGSLPPGTLPPALSVGIKKRLLPFADVEPQRKALAREAQLQAWAHGPQTVPILSQGAGSLLRAPVFGWTAREVIDFSLPESPLRLWEDRVSVVTQLCKAVARVHGVTDASGKPLGLVHRDLTPSNVYITPLREPHDNSDEVRGPTVWLNDFGLAYLSFTETLKDDELCQGSPRFLPPEVQRGEHPAQSADVFQIGLLAGILLGAPMTFPKTTALSLVNLARKELQKFRAEDAVAPEPSHRPTALDLFRLFERERARA